MCEGTLVEYVANSMCEGTMVEYVTNSADKSPL